MIDMEYLINRSTCKFVYVTAIINPFLSQAEATRPFKTP